MNDYVMRILIRSISHASLRIKDCSVKIRDAASYVENENEIVNNNEMNQNSKQIQRKEIGIIKQVARTERTEATEKVTTAATFKGDIYNFFIQKLMVDC